jgi:hypothetical protein
MIRDLDASLKSMIQGEARPGSELASATISFGAPDKDWRGQGAGLELDMYLYRAIDNRELRSNARRRQFNADGSVTDQAPDARIECSYIISAWNKGADVAGLEKEEQEHRLLSQVLYVLSRNPTIPSQYLVGLLANPEIPLPLIAAESEDMSAKPDFWSSLETYVRPSITCRITIAMDLTMDDTSSQLTTIRTILDPGEQMFIIGGMARSAAAPGTTIPKAWVLLDQGPMTCITDGNGAFIFDRITPGAHTLTVRAVGFQQGVRQIHVPEPSGFYDVALTPI